MSHLTQCLISKHDFAQPAQVIATNEIGYLVICQRFHLKCRVQVKPLSVDL